MGDLRHSPLHSRHQALGAKTAPFGGWEMPLEYAGGGVLKEHAAVRDAVGVFDVSHLGNLVLRGPGAAAYVDRCLTNALDRISPGQAQYTLACDDATGGVVDDLIVYLHASDHVLLVPNAANSAEVASRLAGRAPDGVEVVDRHADEAILAVQGPRCDERARRRSDCPVGHAVHVVRAAPSTTAPPVVCRTGYTGERGYELVLPAEGAGALWDALLAAGEPLDVRRLRPRRPRHPAHRDGLPAARPGPRPRHHPRAGPARLGGRLGQAGVLGPRRADGRARAQAAPAAARAACSRPRHPATAHDGVRVDGAAVGEVTSGTFSPTLRTGIGLALLARDVRDGDEVDGRGPRPAGALHRHQARRSSTPTSGAEPVGVSQVRLGNPRFARVVTRANLRFRGEATRYATP